jgi:hypothetical protein
MLAILLVNFAEYDILQLIDLLGITPWCIGVDYLWCVPAADTWLATQCLDWRHGWSADVAAVHTSTC